jgi:hypothetical protein
MNGAFEAHAAHGAAMPTSQVLAELVSAAHGRPVTLAWLLAALGERSYGIVLLVLSLVAVVPGISVLAALTLMIPAWQMASARPAPSFPRFIAERPFDAQRLDGAVRRLMPALVRLERLIRPRWPTPFIATRRVIGVVVLLLAAMQLAPVPMSNLPPAITVMLIAVAYLERDGLVLAIALGIAALAFGAAGFVAWKAGRAGFALL